MTYLGPPSRPESLERIPSGLEQTQGGWMQNASLLSFTLFTKKSWILGKISHLYWNHDLKLVTRWFFFTIFSGAFKWRTMCDYITGYHTTLGLYCCRNRASGSGMLQLFDKRHLLCSLRAGGWIKETSYPSQRGFRLSKQATPLKITCNHNHAFSMPEFLFQIFFILPLQSHFKETKGL